MVAIPCGARRKADSRHAICTIARILTSGVALGKAQWDNTSDKLPCVTCHNGGTGAQANAKIDNTGGIAHNIEGPYFATGHGADVIDNTSTPSQPPIACTSCHGASLGHIGASRPTTTNAWRLLASTNFNVDGGLDNNCSAACHAGAAPADHTDNVANSETHEASDTHATSTASVGLGKGRWFKVSDNVRVLLQGNLVSESYVKDAAGKIVCVTCHGPHGTTTTALPASVRTFFGQNTESNDNNMLRLNYSGGSPPPMCAVCHICHI